jgi:glycosyltransferase involved in cell wall biosynthesis
MRIAIFTDTFFPQVNGVAKSLKRYSDYLLQKGHTVEIFAPELEGNHTYPYVHQFMSIPFFIYPECRTALALPNTILDRIQAFSPDFIHVATPLTMGVLGSHAAKKLNIPIISSYHTHFDQYLDYYKLSWISPILWRYLKWFYSYSERIFVPSQETLTHLQTKEFSNLSIWTRGVDCSLFHPFNQTVNIREKYNIQEPQILLYVGRLAPEKDLTTLQKIIDHTSMEWKEKVHWLIVGDGPSFEELSSHLNERGNVTMTGYLSGSELASCYTASDLLVFPSQTETFGNVVLEALASGTPAVVSNRGGVCGIVEHNKTGKICRAGDYQNFIDQMEQLLSDKVSRLIMAKNAREYALKQTWEGIFDQLISECEQTIKQNFTKYKKNA